jgi:hypothetical protein
VIEIVKIGNPILCSQNSQEAVGKKSRSRISGGGIQTKSSEFIKKNPASPKRDGTSPMKKN